MLNPIKLLALYGDLNKMQSIWKAGTMTPGKLTQLAVLVAQIAAKFGIAAYVQAHFAAWGGAAWAAAVAFSLLTIGHALLPSLIAAPPDVNLAKLAKPTAIALALVFCSGVLHAQAAAAPADVDNLYAAGVSYSVNATPAVAGSALYAHKVADTGTYAFTHVDALPNTLKPFTITTNIGGGIAQKLVTFGNVPIFMPTAAGISFNGSNTGWQWNGGVLAAIHVRKQYYVLPTVRFLKSSVSNGTGYQPIFGVLFGWGQ